MVSLALLVVALFLLPLAIHLSTRKRGTKQGVRWHGIQWKTDAAFDALVESALAKQRGGDVRGAIAVYDQALTRKRSGLVLNNRGCALLELGEVTPAIADLREAVALDPLNATAHCSLAEALARAGEHGPALESLMRAAALDPQWREHAKTAEAFTALREKPEWASWISEGGPR